MRNLAAEIFAPLAALLFVLVFVGPAVAQEGGWVRKSGRAGDFGLVRGGRAAGAHVLRIYMLDPGVVLDKIVLNVGNLRSSYLGPPETRVVSK